MDKTRGEVLPITPGSGEGRPRDRPVYLGHRGDSSASFVKFRGLHLGDDWESKGGTFFPCFRRKGAAVG